MRLIAINADRWSPVRCFLFVYVYYVAGNWRHGGSWVRVLAVLCCRPSGRKHRLREDMRFEFDDP